MGIENTQISRAESSRQSLDIEDRKLVAALWKYQQNRPQPATGHAKKALIGL